MSVTGVIVAAVIVGCTRMFDGIFLMLCIRKVQG